MIRIREVRTGGYYFYPYGTTSMGNNIPLEVTYRLSIDGKLIDSFLSKRAANRAKRRLSK